MTIILSHPMTVQEIRVLQEYRRMAADTLSLAAINAIKHPSGGGEAPAASLVSKGFLTADSAGENFTLTDKGKKFLTLDPKPEFEEPAAGESPAAVE